VLLLLAAAAAGTARLSTHALALQQLHLLGSSSTCIRT
jgi:hypothetical protein